MLMELAQKNPNFEKNKIENRFKFLNNVNKLIALES
jgi:hypothetical protein